MDRAAVANMTTGMPATAAPNMVMVPRGEMKVEKIAGRMKVTCVCDDAAACAMIQGCCDCVAACMKAGCTCCLMMGGTPVCCCVC